MATYLDGNVRKATPNTVTAMHNSAERRRCPKCNRKSALLYLRDDWGDRVVTVEVCRWKLSGKCDHEVLTTLGREVADAE